MLIKSYVNKRNYISSLYQNEFLFRLELSSDIYKFFQIKKASKINEKNQKEEDKKKAGWKKKESALLCISCTHTHD